MATTPSRAKYLQIADDLRAKISDGTYPVDSPLPSTSHLMSTYDVSITVARAAVKELQNERLVAGQPARPSTSSESRNRPTRAPSTPRSWVRSAICARP